MSLKDVNVARRCNMKNLNSRKIQTIIFLTFAMLCLYFKCQPNSFQKMPSQAIESNTIRRKPFGNILLVLNFNFPHYDNIPILREMYEDVFEKIVICGPNDFDKVSDKVDYSIEEPDFKIPHYRGYFGYHCVTVAMEIYPGFKGYMYSSDDIIINWWNLVNRDRDKIWEGFKDVKYHRISDLKSLNDSWIWWETDLGILACKTFYGELRNKSKVSTDIRTAYQTALNNGGGLERCAKSWSDFFYVPQKFAKTFGQLSQIAYKNKLFLEIAVSTIMRCLDNPDNYENVDGFYFPTIDIWQVSAETFWKHYNHTLSFIHPFKFHLHTDMAKYNIKMLKDNFINYRKDILKYLGY